MNDITGKQITLRTAVATGALFCEPNTIELIKNNQIPKGNPLEMAKAAAFFGAKKTDQLLPHCHPVVIDGMQVDFEFIEPSSSTTFDSKNELRTGILITVEGKSIGRTGIEMEALTAVSIAALTIYDMLKPVDKKLEIGAIKLLDKKGGKSDRSKFFATPPTCAVLVCSNAKAEGKREDNSGAIILELLNKVNANIVEYSILPDDKTQIQAKIKSLVVQDVHVIFTSGGTGLSKHDHTVDAVAELLEKQADGIVEAMHSFGQMRSPVAMLSRAVAGSIANTLIVTLPGSTEGAKESMEAIVPAIFHARKMLKGGGF